MVVDVGTVLPVQFGRFFRVRWGFVSQCWMVGGVPFVVLLFWWVLVGWLFIYTLTILDLDGSFRADL